MAAKLSVAFLILGLIKATGAISALDFGMQMSQNAYDAICWYENLKQFPHTNTTAFNYCVGAAKHVRNSIMTQDFFKQYPKLKEEYFGKWMNDQAMQRIPTSYKLTCDKYLTEPRAKIAVNESEALNDGGNNFPFKAFSYCLLNKLRKTHGATAIEHVKNERTVTLKNWMQTLLDRDNEFRKRHQVEPMKLVKGLNEAAQKWADKLARECQMYHSSNSDPGRIWQGKGTGESLATGSSDDDAAVNAYIASNGWYEEIKDYPYPEGFQGGDDELFHKIGHFTQTVWKDTKYVGYGYAYNKECPSFKFYIAARYSPPGNVEGQYSSKVLPPKDS